MKLKPYDKLSTGEQTVLIELMFWKRVIKSIPDDSEVKAFYEKFVKAAGVLSE